jgi:bifunctional non-homologous end joining protein LigD
MPVRWDELDDPELRSDRWTLRDAGARVLDVGDLFAEVPTRAQRLPSL